MLGERLAQQLALRRVVGGLEAAQQLVERVQHLLGEPLADLVLELAAVLEERGEALRARQAEQPLLGRAAGAARSRSAGPRSATMSATRKSSQPELSPRGAEMRRSARPLKSRPAGTPVSRSSRSMRPCGRGLELPVAADDAVEVLAGLERRARGAATADAPSCGSSSRTAKSGRSVSP